MATIDTNMSLVMIDPNEPLELYDGTIIKGRLEWFLYALCCLDYGNLPTPLSRIEEWANALITNELPNMEPQSRAEEFFKAILTGDTSNLPTPQSRSEVLLDKLARGENDFTNVEKIQSRYEFLLAYLIKNGGGIGNIDYVLYEFSEKMKTMYNTIEKPFKLLELSGNTLVNCVLEDTENDDHTSFDKDYSGTSFTINGTSEGAIKSAILKGQTLVNVWNKHDTHNKYGFILHDDGFMELKPNVLYLDHIQKSTSCLKPNTKYLLIVEVKDNTLPGNIYIQPDNRTYFYNNERVTLYPPKTNGVTKTLLTTIPDFSTTRDDLRWGVYIQHAQNNVDESERGTVKIRQMLIEYQDGMENWDVPYFEGMQSVKMPVLTTTGKNLFDVSSYVKGAMEKEYYSQNGDKLQINNLDGRTNVTYGAYKAKKGETLTLSTNPKVPLRIFDITSGIMHGSSTDGILTYTAKTDGEIGFKFIAYEYPTLINVQLEKGTDATPYEPYKSNILTVNEDVTLRGIGDVQDTLDCLTGEVVQSIYNLQLTGDESWGQSGFTNDDYFVAYTAFANNLSIPSSKVICDKLNYDSSISVTDTKTEGINIIGDCSLRISLSKTKVATLNDFINWIRQEQPVINFVAKEKSIKTVDLEVVDQNNTKIDKIHVFDETTHVNTSSDELTPTVNIGKSVSYPTIIKPNTKYTVDLKRNDKPLTINLGGTEVTFASGETRKVITTPSTLINDKLSYYGVGAKCNEIMLIEGEVERNVDYFTGMQSVVMQNQMPILSTVGKNLFNPTKMIIGDGSLYGYYKFKDNENIKYTLSISDKDTSVDVSGIYLGMSKLGINASGGFNWLLNSGSITNTNTMSITNNFNYVSIYPNNIATLNKLTKRFNIQVEYGEVKTTYEPHKTSILSCNEDVTLRGIGDVRDTLDGNTGELTQRIGEVVLDGNQNFIAWGSYGFYISDSTLTSSSTVQCINNKYPSYTNASELSKATGNGIAVNNSRLYIKINEVTSVNEFVAYLKSNPITVQYQLATESVKTVDLTITDQGGATIPKLKTFDKITHVNVSATDILPGVEMEVATTIGDDLSGTLYSTMEDIETKQEALKESNNAQTESVNSTMMATTEIYESLL